MICDKNDLYNNYFVVVHEHIIMEITGYDENDARNIDYRLDCEATFEKSKTCSFL